jgi:hypothetical protein
MMKNILAGLLVVLLFALLFLGMLRLRGCLHYGLFYKDKVGEELTPLIERIEQLEERVKRLENEGDNDE